MNVGLDRKYVASLQSETSTKSDMLSIRQPYSKTQENIIGKSKFTADRLINTPERYLGSLSVLIFLNRSDVNT